MVCPICDRLTSEVSFRVREFALAIERLGAAQVTGTPEECAELSDKYGDASLERDLARLELERHQRIHRSAAAA
jgi:hypothetical protein